MKKFIGIFVALLLFAACSSQKEYTFKPLGKPDKSWVGKTIQIKFGKLNESWLQNKTFIVKITGHYMERGYACFRLAEKFHSNEGKKLYLMWFGKSYAPQITEWKEAILKKK